MNRFLALISFVLCCVATMNSYSKPCCSFYNRGAKGTDMFCSTYKYPTEEAFKICTNEVRRSGKIQEFKFGEGECSKEGVIQCENKGKPLEDQKLSVDITYFSTTVLKNNILKITWGTTNETDNLGMNLWCAQMQGNHFEEITKLNTRLIPSEAILPNYGTSYSSTDYPYVDTNLKPGIQYCALEDIDASGECMLHCDQIDIAVIGDDNSISDTELDELRSKAITLCNDHQLNGMCLDQLLVPSTM